jgi:thiamine-phosphate pyrophosphorylase
LFCRGEAPIDENLTDRLIDLVQARGIACLIEEDAELAERLGADGVHIEANPAAYTQARALLGSEASIGVGCGLSRHEAMRLAEMGADYVAFGATGEGGIDAIDQRAELIAWWSEIFVVPCVAWNVESVEEAERLAALGADFVAPAAQVWQEAGAASLIAELDRAIGRVRRAA